MPDVEGRVMLWFGFAEASQFHQLPLSAQAEFVRSALSSVRALVPPAILQRWHRLRLPVDTQGFKPQEEIRQLLAREIDHLNRTISADALADPRFQLDGEAVRMVRYNIHDNVRCSESWYDLLLDGHPWTISRGDFTVRMAIQLKWEWDI